MDCLRFAYGCNVARRRNAAKIVNVFQLEGDRSDPWFWKLWGKTPWTGPGTIQILQTLLFGSRQCVCESVCACERGGIDQLKSSPARQSSVSQVTVTRPDSGPRHSHQPPGF